MQGEPSGAELAIVFAFYGVVFLVGLGIQALISYFLYRAASALPEDTRLCTPGGAFLLMIPCFNIVWIFLYTANLSKSFQHALGRIGRLTDDCGEKFGLWWGICAIASIIPCVGGIIAIAGLVLMILYLVKVNECRNILLSAGSGGFNQMYSGGPAAYPTKPPSDNPYTF